MATSDANYPLFSRIPLAGKLDNAPRRRSAPRRAAAIPARRRPGASVCASFADLDIVINKNFAKARYPPSVSRATIFVGLYRSSSTNRGNRVFRRPTF